MPKTAEEIAKWDTDKCLQIAESLPDTYGTEVQRKLLAVLLFPEVRRMSITERCKVSSISRVEYYRLMSREDFLDKVAEVTKKVKKRHVPDVYGSFVNNAVNGGKDGMGNVTAQLAYLRDPDVGIIAPEETKVDHRIMRKEIRDKTLDGLEAFDKAFDAEWEDVSDETDIRGTDGGDMGDERTTGIEQHDMGNETEKADQDPNQPDSHSVGQDGRLRDDNRDGKEETDTSRLEQGGSKEGDDELPCSDGQGNEHHDTDAPRAIDNGEVSRDKGSDAGQRSPNAPHSPGQSIDNGENDIKGGDASISLDATSPDSPRADTPHDDAMKEDDNSNVSKSKGGHPPTPGADERKEM